MGIAEWLGGVAVGVAREVSAQIRQFTRKLTPGEQRAQLEDWNRNHVPSTSSPMGECLVCGRPRALDTAHCPGPLKAWAMTRPQTAQCAVQYQHTRAIGVGTIYIAGCEICDASYLGHGGAP